MADRRLLWRTAQVALGITVVGLGVRALAENWAAFRAQDVAWRFCGLWLAASVALVFAMYAVLIEAWRRVVIGLGQQLSFASAARIWALASLGKYIPGKVWAIAGAAALSRQAGIHPQAAVTGALVLQALAVASGLVVTAIAAPAALGEAGPLWATVGLAVVALTIVAGSASPVVIARLGRLIPGMTGTLPSVPRHLVAQAFAANCVAWIGYGVAFLFLTRGVFPDAAMSLGQAVGVFAASYLVGLIALFAPGGIGPRESALLLLLGPVLGLKLAVALAVTSRLQLTVTELGVALPFLLGMSRPRGSSAPG